MTRPGTRTSTARQVRPSRASESARSNLQASRLLGLTLRQSELAAIHVVPRGISQVLAGGFPGTDCSDCRCLQASWMTSTVRRLIFANH